MVLGKVAGIIRKTLYAFQHLTFLIGTMIQLSFNNRAGLFYQMKNDFQGISYDQ